MVPFLKRKKNYYKSNWYLRVSIAGYDNMGLSKHGNVAIYACMVVSYFFGLKMSWKFQIIQINMSMFKWFLAVTRPNKQKKTNEGERGLELDTKQTHIRDPFENEKNKQISTLGTLWWIQFFLGMASFRQWWRTKHDS